MDDTHLASLLVGRWPSGAPVNRAQGADIPELGADAFANNNFQFDSDTPFLKLAGSHKDPYPQGKADPAGAAGVVGEFRHAYARQLDLRGVTCHHTAGDVFFALAVFVAAITEREWFHKLLAPAAGLSFSLYITLLYARL
jgi:hypothetical protein